MEFLLFHALFKGFFMRESSTKLRYIKSKNIETISHYVNMLPYRIEIKGNPIFVSKKWVLWFVIGDNVENEILSGDID